MFWGSTWFSSDSFRKKKTYLYVDNVHSLPLHSPSLNPTTVHSILRNLIETQFFKLINKYESLFLFVTSRSVIQNYRREDSFHFTWENKTYWKAIGHSIESKNVYKFQGYLKAYSWKRFCFLGSSCTHDVTNSTYSLTNRRLYPSDIPEHTIKPEVNTRLDILKDQPSVYEVFSS